ncbi:hypothetical protein KFU94_28880 [Chloroflexi bacterium TSY]|nr:hypothetical protein [Chloroflexi bacterium TSY]
MNGPTALVVAAGLTYSFTVAPQLVNAQAGQSTTFDSPLDGKDHRGSRNDRNGRTSAFQTHLAEALGITLEELQAAQETAREDSVGEESSQERLAEVLGITVDELQVARQEAIQSALEQAIEDGRITEEQAELREVAQDLREFIDGAALLADALGVSVEDLETARETGTSLRDLIDELNLDPSTVRENLQTGYDAAVQQAVDEGIVTQEQAEALQVNDRTFPNAGNRDNRRDGERDRRANSNRARSRNSDDESFANDNLTNEALIEDESEQNSLDSNSNTNIQNTLTVSTTASDADDENEAENNVTETIADDAQNNTPGNEESADEDRPNRRRGNGNRRGQPRNDTQQDQNEPETAQDNDNDNGDDDSSDNGSESTGNSDESGDETPSRERPRRGQRGQGRG